MVTSCLYIPQKGLKRESVDMRKYLSMDFEFYPDTVPIGYDALITIRWKNVSDSSFFLYPKSIMTLSPDTPYIDSVNFLPGLYTSYSFVGCSLGEHVDFDERFFLLPGEEYSEVFVINANILQKKQHFTRGTGYYSLSHYNIMDSMRYGFSFSPYHPLTIIEINDSLRTQTP